ncbi:glycosyltransferase family 4 protein [Chloroflexota bacterium]
MKIAIIVPLFPPKWMAGIEIVTWNISKYLAARGHEVHVITTRDKGLAAVSMEEGFYVHRIWNLKTRFLGPALFSVKTLLVLRKIKPDIVHAHSLISGLYALIAKKFLEKPYIFSEHGGVYFPSILHNYVLKMVLRNANSVIALTEDMREEMRKIFNRDIKVVPNGIDLEKFDGLPKNEMRDKLQFKPDEKLVIFVGRFRPEKGVEYLIKAMEIVSQSDCSSRLILAGEGPEEENLKSLTEQLKLRGCVEFVGQIPNKKVPEYLAVSDIFVLPSLSEGFPLVLLEAMASGLSIVTTRVTSLPEIIKDGENGFLVEPRNPEQIAEKVLLLFKDHELMGEISRNNKEKAKYYSWDNIVNSIEEIYQNYL